MPSTSSSATLRLRLQPWPCDYPYHMVYHRVLGPHVQWTAGGWSGVCPRLAVCFGAHGVPEHPAWRRLRLSQHPLCPQHLYLPPVLPAVCREPRGQGLQLFGECQACGHSAWWPVACPLPATLPCEWRFLYGKLLMNLDARPTKSYCQIVERHL